jgi:hypothetical protein
MQDGVNSKQQATANLPRCSEHSADVIHKGTQGRDGVGLQIAREGSADRAGSHSRTGSLGGHVAGSLIHGHGTKDNANEDGVVSMVRNGEPVPIPELRHGISAVSFTSSEESRGRGTHRRGKPSLSPGRVDVRAGAVLACTGHRWEYTASRSGGDVRHPAKEAFDSRMVSEVPQSISIVNAEKPSNGTPGTQAANPSTQHQPDVSGPQVAVPLLIPDIIRAAMGQEEHGGVSSAGTQGASPFGPELMRMSVATSMPGGRRVLSGDAAGQEQPSARAPLGSPPRQSLNLGGRVRYIVGYF